MIIDKLTICLVFTFLLLSCETINETQRLEEYEKREYAFIEGIENYDDLDLREKANDDFAKWLLKDTCTFHYNFPNATDSTEIVTIADSDDGNVRIYSWDTQLGGTMICWDNVIQFRSNGKIRSFDGSTWRIDGSTDEEDEMDFGCWTKAIYTFKRNNGQTIYVTESYFRISSSYGYSTLDAFCISNGKLQTIENAFVAPDENFHIGTEYSIPSWYFLTEGKGWDWIFSLDRNTQTFYVPVVDDIILLDQYDLYKFNGFEFVYSGREGGHWLHPSIRKFNRLEKLAQIGKYLIRIDRTSSGVFRYTSWNGTENMNQKPDILIENGKYNEDKNEYHFINGDYIYIIAEKEDETELIVKHKNKVMLRLNK